MDRKTPLWFNSLLCLAIALALVVFWMRSPPIPSSAASTPSTPASTEIRGVWLTNVSSGVLFSPWGINRAIDQLSQLNFNTVYPVVWNRAHTFYPSTVAKEITGRSQERLLTIMRPKKDSLAEIIDLSHRRGLRVIPWFEYGFMAPANSELVKRHPDWITTSWDGIKGNRHGTFALEWLNPLHPEVQQFLIDLIREVVSHYDIEGIQIDDHFGMPVEYGYDPFTISLYQQEHQGKSPPNNYQDPQWMRWRADKITDFMQQVLNNVKSINPNCLVSLSPNSQDFSYRNYLQDWQTWVQRGLVEELILQVYRGNLPDFREELEKPAVQMARRRIPVGVGITSGTLRNPVKIEQIREQVAEVRDRLFDGVSFFYWESLWGYIAPESPRQRRKVFGELFSAPETGQG